MVKTYTLICILLFTFLECSFAQHGISYCWSVNPEYPIAKMVSTANNVGGVANNMLIEPDGTVIVFWTETDLQTNKQQIVYAGTKDKGKSWNNPLPTYFSPSQKTSIPSGVSAASDTAGNIYVSWKSFFPEAIFFAQYDYKTKVWSDTIRVSEYVNHNISFQFLTVDRKGHIHIMWHDGGDASNETAEVMYSKSNTKGVTWQAQLMLSKNDGHHSKFPVADYIGTTSDTLAITWRDSIDKTDEWDVMMAVTYNGGKTWQTSFTVAGGAQSQHDSYFIIDKNGRFHLLYDEYVGGCMAGCSRMMYGFSKDAGKTWKGGFKAVSDTTIHSRLPKGAYDFKNDIVWLSWKDERDFDAQTGNHKADIMVMKVTNSGNMIGTAEFATDQFDKEVGFHNFIAADDGTLKATYNYDFNSSDPLDLYYREYGCDEKGNVISVIGEPISLGEISVFPNPSSRAFRVQANEEIMKITLFNSNGQYVPLHYNMIENQCSVDVLDKPTGLYTLVVQTSKQCYVQKLLIQH